MAEGDHQDEGGINVSILGHTSLHLTFNSFLQVQSLSDTSHMERKVLLDKTLCPQTVQQNSSDRLSLTTATLGF